jgi:hypothetical protein
MPTLTQADINAMSAFYTLGAVTSDKDIDDVEKSIKDTVQKNFYTAKHNTEKLEEATNAYAFYASRNKSLTDVFTSLTDTNKKTENSIERELTTTSRQVEINQWEYEHKMETLFFLQLLFIALCISAGILYLRHIQILTPSVTYIILSIVGLILLMILLNRMSYTLKKRDKKYWNRGSIPSGSLGIGNKCP